MHRVKGTLPEENVCGGGDYEAGEGRKGAPRLLRTGLLTQRALTDSLSG